MLLFLQKVDYASNGGSDLSLFTKPMISAQDHPAIITLGRKEQNKEF